MAANERRWGQQGDVDDIVERHYELVRRVCRAHLSRRDEIQDAVQETFAQFLLADLDRIANVEAWLVTVAVRVCGHTHRWRYNHPEYDGEFDLDPRQTDGNLDGVLDSVWIDRVMKHLPSEERRLLQWLYLEDASRDEIANRLGVSTDHLRVLAFRARINARRLFRAFDDPRGLF